MRGLLFAGLVSSLMPSGLLAAQQQPSVAVAATTAGGAIVKTVLTTTTGQAADPPSSASREDRSVSVDDQALAAVFTGVAGSGAQAYTVSASISAAEYGVTSQVRASTPTEQEVANAPKDELAVPKQGESSQISYALVLALIALIGLVPVSRRSE